MAFEVVLYYNDSEKNRLSKSLRLLQTLTGELRDETSIINPSILFEDTVTTLTRANYLYIADFGRYYYINDIRSIRNGLTEVSCHVDVLMSFASEIKTNNAIINRSENNWNLYLNDGSLKVYSNSIVLTKKFPSGFTTQNYVMAVASPDN